jgi:hypothetical protein
MEKPIKKRELDKVREVAREYEKKGYEVFANPSKKDLPKELQGLNYEPVLIARLGDENLVIEVKTYETIKNSRLDSVASFINNLDNWQFELVYTNPKSKRTMKPSNEALSVKGVLSSLDRARKFIESDLGGEFTDAGLLLVWSAVEKSIRAAFLSYKSQDSSKNPNAMIRDSVMLGIIDKRQYNYLESMMKTRNEMAHGMDGERISQHQLNQLLEIGYEVSRQIS